MSMPVMDGMSATRAIRKYEAEYNIPRCCIVALTGLASASAKLEAWNAGIDHFMTKPVNFKALEKYLKGERMKREKREEDREALKGKSDLAGAGRDGGGGGNMDGGDEGGVEGYSNSNSNSASNETSNENSNENSNETSEAEGENK